MPRDAVDVYVTDQFKTASINMVKKVLQKSQVSRTVKNNGKLIACSVVGADLSVDFYNGGNGHPDHCDLYIGNEKIRYVSEQTQQLYDAFHERYSMQSKEQTTAKEQELAKKLQMMIDGGMEK